MQILIIDGQPICPEWVETWRPHIDNEQCRETVLDSLVAFAGMKREAAQRWLDTFTRYVRSLR